MILDQIVEKRCEQLTREIKAISRSEIIQAALSMNTKTKGFEHGLREPGKKPLAVIAEVKKASPSKGIIKHDFQPVEIAREYEKAGANAVSVLTEEHYFKGSSMFLKQIRKAVELPILRKDFIIDDYQLYEARMLGADAVLLIAAILPREKLMEFMLLAQALSLDCLVEVHDEKEVETALFCNAFIIGINNRNLQTFTVTLDTTKLLSALIPKGCVIVSESGIATNADMHMVQKCGVDAVLIGETLMKSSDIRKSMNALREGV